MKPKGLTPLLPRETTDIKELCYGQLQGIVIDATNSQCQRFIGITTTQYAF